MKIIKNIVAAVLVLSIVFSVPGCSGGKTHNKVSSKATSSSSDPYANLKENPRAKLDGTFIQSWLCSCWTDERWQQELQNLKSLGMEYLILGDSADKNKSGTWYTYYPSQLSGLKDGYGGRDVIENALRNCKKAGIKVFIGMGFDESWWDNFKNATWLNAAAEQYNKICDEIYSKYHSRYSGTFYGWYWVPEIWNDTSYANENRKSAIKALSDAMNINLDHISKLDTSLPLLFSPFVNNQMTSADDLYLFYRDLFKTTHFRSGDILCPQDSIGAGGNKLPYLGVWTMNYRKAVDTKPGLRFWSNCEDFDKKSDDLTTSASLNRFAKQMQIVSKYCEHIITFAYCHYYSPYNTVTGFNNAYKLYLETGKVETNPPTAPKNLTVKIQDEGALIQWSASSDNTGIAGYYVYRNGTLIDTIVGKITNNVGKPTIDTISADFDAVKSLVNGKSTYEVEAFDCAGNKSTRASVVLEK